MHHGAAFDIQAVCSGFVYGVHVANALLKSGGAKRAILIGAETFSRILDWEDRGTCVLFGDGAGAIVIEAVEDAEDGILHTYVRSDGRHRDMLYVDGGPSRTQTVGHLRMLGNQVFKHAVTDIAQVMRDCAEQAGIEIADIDWFVPHQANQRILNAVAKRLKLRPEQVVSKKGDLVMLEAFGGGFTWGAALVRY